MICKVCGGEFNIRNFDICPYCLAPIRENSEESKNREKDDLIIFKGGERTDQDEKRNIGFFMSSRDVDQTIEDEKDSELSKFISGNEKEKRVHKEEILIEDIILLSTRAKNVLKRNNIFRISQISEFLEQCNIENLKNVGEKTKKEILSIAEMFSSNYDESDKYDNIRLSNNEAQSKCFFENIAKSNMNLPISVTSELGLTPHNVKILIKNGYQKCEDLMGITVGTICELVGNRNIERVQQLSNELEKDVVQLLEQLLDKYILKKEGSIFLRRATGETLQEIADNPGVGMESITRERVRQIESKFLGKIKPFVYCIVEQLREDKKYIFVKDILDIYDNDNFDRIMTYACRQMDSYEYLDFADVFVVRENDKKIENMILKLAEDFVGDGIDLYENMEALEELLNENNLDYISLGEFMNLLQKYNYCFYGDYVVKGRVGYGILCIDLIRKNYPDGIKLTQNESEQEGDLSNLRKLVTDKYKNLYIPDSNRAFSSALVRSGLVLCDRGKYITEENIVIDELILQDIKKYIDDKKENKVFYAEIYSQFEGVLQLTSSINNYNYLHGVLMLYYPTEYEYTRDYLIKKGLVIQSSGTIADRIYAYIKKIGRPVHKKELKKYFAGFSDTMIFTPIANDSRLIQWEYNYFTSMDLLDITLEDYKNLWEIIQELFDENNGYSSDIMLYNSLKREYTTFLEKNNIKSAMNLHYIVAQLFSDRCDFRRPHIGMKGKFEKFTVKDVALHLLGNPEVLLYSDYIKVAEKMCWSAVTVGIVFSDIEKDYVRVAQDRYIKKHVFHIKKEDIYTIYKIVYNHMENNVFAIQNYDNIEGFPDIGYDWNEFLLGSILDLYTDDIRVIQPIMKDRRYQRGIAVNTNSGLTSYPEVVAYVMISNNIESLSESQFLSFLLIHGLARKAIPHELTNSEYVKFEEGRYKVIL